MTTKDIARMTQRLGGVVAVAAVVAFVGGTVTIAANDKDYGKDSKKEDKKDKDHDKDDKNHKNVKRVWRRLNVCHLEKDGRAHLLEISEEVLTAHRGHGDGEPGERVARYHHGRFHRWTRECKEVPEPPAPPPPPPPPVPPAPPADPTLSCPCWSGMKQSALLGVLDSQSSPASPQCVVNGTTVSLSQDQGISTLVYSAVFGQCIQRVGGVDVGSNFGLTGEEATTCMAEGTALAPLVKWCSQ